MQSEIKVVQIDEHRESPLNSWRALLVETALLYAYMSAKPQAAAATATAPGPSPLHS